jgi:hypothetical protein
MAKSRTSPTIPTTVMGCMSPSMLAKLMSLPSGSSPGQRALCQRLVDHRHVRRVEAVALVEQPAADQRDFQRAEEPVAGHPEAGLARALRDRVRAPQSSKLWISPGGSG